ncbi:MAG: TIGR02281 family clan AA aspartic protease [Rickettsiales bacterium]
MKISKWIVIILLVFLFYNIYQKYSYKIEGGEQAANLIYFLMLLSFLMVSFFSRKINLNTIIKSALIWILIFLLLIAGYSYKSEIQKVAKKVYSNINPSYNYSSERGKLVINKGHSGHYYVNAKIKGVDIRFLVDTGASITTLTLSDAKRLGVEIKELKFDRYVSTANGSNKAAYYVVSDVDVGDIYIRSLKVYIIKNGLSVSLLGMNFLNRVDSFKFNDDKLEIVG